MSLIRPVTAAEIAASGVARGWESYDANACQGEGFWFSGDQIEGVVPHVRPSFRIFSLEISKPCTRSRFIV